jgi:2-dehydropantoate 2-reductase
LLFERERGGVQEETAVPEVAVIGSGAVGTVAASAAEQAGLDVVICARPPAGGPLVLELDAQERRLAAPLITDPDKARPVDWVLLATKAQQSPQAEPWLSRLCHPGTVVVVMQNGVDHVERVAPLAGGATVLPALVYVAVERVAQGRVVHRRGRRVVVPAGRAGRAFADLMKASWLEIVEDPDFRTAAWRKLLGNVAANPVTALTGRRMGVLSDPEIRELFHVLIAEAVAVGIAEGAKLGPEDVPATMAFYGQFGDDDGTSMLYDRLAGRELENELLSGAITRLGRQHGVPTPANQTLYALLGALAPQEAPR